MSDTDTGRDEKGLFTKGNQISKDGGRPLAFKTPEELWEAACDYFDHVDSNPWIKKEALKSGLNAGQLIDVPTQIPYTMHGFCVHLDQSIEWWYQMVKRAKEKEQFGFLQIINKIKSRMYAQKFTGAACGAFQHMIIARDLGLQEKAAHEHSGPSGGPIETITSEMSADQASEIYSKLIGGDKK